MKPSVISKCLAMSVLSMGVATAHAATVWDETSNGDLSNNGLSPTLVVVSPGSNLVLGLTGDSGQGVDRDYFKIIVPAGSTLTSIELLANTAVSVGVSFIGMQAGPQLTVTPSGGGAEQLLASGHYGNDQIGTDLLPAIELGPAGPLPNGTYSVWVQDTGGPASYGFDFVLSAVAAPAAAPSLPGWGLIVLGATLGLITWQKLARSRGLHVQGRAVT